MIIRYNFSLNFSKFRLTREAEGVYNPRNPVKGYKRGGPPKRPHALLDGLTPVMFYDMIKQQGDRELNPGYPPKKGSVAV